MIALDAMGGDFAPAAAVEGALRAKRERGLDVLLVGDSARLEAEVRRLGASAAELPIHHASQVVEMGEHPGNAMRRKKDNSIRVCFDLVKAGQCEGVLSAGNSGAVLAGGLFVLGRLGGVERPCIGGSLPSLGGANRVVLVDMGANTVCKPIHLVQFALMGEVYTRRVFKVDKPRVGVVANGEEEGKGTDLTREAHRLLRDAPPPVDFEFAGYAEGRDFFGGRFDVVVTDGFTGNIALKTYEGTARMIFELLEAEVKRSGRYKLGAWLLLPALRALRRRLEAEEYGGALLLGLQGVAMICHGRSSPKAIKNALFAADRLAGAGLTPALSSAIERHRKLWESEPEQGMEQGTEAATEPTRSTDGGSDAAGERNPTYNRELASGGRGPSER